MLHAQRGGASIKDGRGKREDGVVEPDARLVFAVLAAGIILGALVTPPRGDTPGADTSAIQPAGDR
jgi:hypothetical protein